MDIYNARRQLKTQSIYDLPLRVTYYARVSTDTEEQRNSLENQTSYYPNYIQSHPNWTLVEGYIDEGISGISTKHRENFLDMIADAKQNKFDMIITKEISRFARNTVDSIQYTRDLLNMGVCVFFQNDGINTIDEDSELRLTIMSGIAQDELRKLSSRVKWGHQQAIKNGVVLGNSRLFGYVKKDKHLAIDENEAEMVREVFRMYATDSYSMKDIENKLWEQGYRNHNGNKISHTTLSNMISNPKYKGYYVGNKVRVVDLFTKKQKFLPQEEWVMYRDESLVPAIVSEELWDRANAVLARRSKDVKERQNKCTHANLLTGKLICTHCGAPYYRKDSVYKGKRRSRWVCSEKIKNGADSCPSFIIDEAEIQQVLFDTFAHTKDVAHKYIEEYMKIYSKVTLPDYQGQQSKLQTALEKQKTKQLKLLELYTEGIVSKSDYQRMNEQCTQDVEAAQEKLHELNMALEAKKNVAQNLEVLRQFLETAADEATKNGHVSAQFINRYIDAIYVTPEGDTMRLDIRLFSGAHASGILGRTGHTRKKICPERLISFERASRNKPNHKVIYTYATSLSI